MVPQLSCVRTIGAAFYQFHYYSILPSISSCFHQTSDKLRELHKSEYRLELYCYAAFDATIRKNDLISLICDDDA